MLPRISSLLLILATFTNLATATVTTPTTHFSPTRAQTPIGTSAAFLASSTLSALDQSWKNSPTYTSIEVAVFYAAPTTAQLSLAISGYNWDTIVAEPWYEDVEKGWRDCVDEQESVLQNGLDTAIASGGERVGLGLGTGMSVLVGVVGLVVVVLL